MKAIYSKILLFAICLGAAVSFCSPAQAESMFGDEGNYNPMRKGKPNEEGQLYVPGTKMYDLYMLRERDKFIRAEWQRRLPEIEAEYRRKYGQPLSERK